MIKAIILDFGRVISAQKPRHLFRSYEEDLGLEPDSINSIMFDSLAWQDALLGKKTIEEYWQAIGPELGLHSPEDIHLFWERYHGDEAMNTAVVDLIRRLCGRFKLAVLSNSPRGLIRWLMDWGISDLFDVVFCSGDEGVVKPDHASFLITLGRLGVEPDKAVFIDDTVEHVEAAESLGMKGIVFTSAAGLAKELGRLLPLDLDEIILPGVSTE